MENCFILLRPVSKISDFYLDVRRLIATARIPRPSSKAVAGSGTRKMLPVASKLLGCGLGARIGGMSPRESLLLGAGMVSRGEVGLIVATLGLTHNLIDQKIFSMTVVTVIVVTLLSPILLHHFVPKSETTMAAEPTLPPE